MKNDQISLRPSLAILEQLYDAFNSEFFQGLLPDCVITMSPDDTKGGAFGWFTTGTPWIDRDGRAWHEINISSNYLQRDFYDIAGTLLHEMVHFYNLKKGVKDCTRNGTYHNKNFLSACVSHGLHCERPEGSPYGWHFTKLTPESKAVAARFEADFYMSRPVKKVPRTRAKAKSYRYVCPVCGAIVRSTKPVRIRCEDCDVTMELEG